MIQVLKQIKQAIEISVFPKAYKAKFFRTIQELNWKHLVVSSRPVSIRDVAFLTQGKCVKG